MKHLLSFALSALMILSLAACGSAPADQGAEEDSIPAPPQPTLEELQAQQIQDLLDNMTLEEQVGQLFFPRCPAEDAVEDISTYHLGGYILFGRDYKDAEENWLNQDQFTAVLQSYQDAAKIPLLIGTDEEGGTVARASRNTNFRAEKFQSPQELFAQGGLQAILDDAAEKDALLHSIGINVNLAPVADVSYDPVDFIYDRSYGQDATSTADYISQVVTQMAGDNMGSVLKHFPGYGNNVDTHTGIAIDERPLSQFQAEDFLPFAAGTEAGQGKTAVMVSHNIMTTVDDQLPASLSPAVHDLLRSELNFDGVVMTDDLAMDAVAAYAEDGASAVMALEAGNDLIITSDYRTQIPKVIAAFQDGTLDSQILLPACRRVLEWKQSLGLLPAVSPEV